MAIALAVETENDEDMGSNIIEKDAKSSTVEILALVATKIDVAKPFILFQENTNNKVDDTLLPSDFIYCENYYSFILFRKRILQLETTGSRCNGCVLTDDRAREFRFLELNARDDDLLDAFCWSCVSFGVRDRRQKLFGRILSTQR